MRRRRRRRRRRRMMIKTEVTGSSEMSDHI
jgi:hypothetical protein